VKSVRQTDFALYPEASMQALHFNTRGRTIRRAASIALCGVFLLSAGIGNSQIAGTANIQGTVTDSTGAVVPSATVTLTDEATHVKRTTSTSGAGVYLFPAIPIGTYDLTAAASGFKTYEQTHIVLEVGSSIAVNPTLSVGAADVKVEVQAEGLALQTEDPTFKQTIDQNEVNEMPLNGRQMTALITLSGGSSIAPNGDFTGSKYSYQTISVSVAGGGGNTTLWRLDGGDNQDYMANGNLPYPFPDAVSEFSVESTDLGAQDGGHVGGLVNVVTKSGTNQYHGEAFEFIRNNYLDATNFFSTCTPVAPKTTCSAKDTLHQNQFGGTFGGPIKRNKMFAFAAYQRTDAKQSQASTQAQVPTAANLNGDWSTSDGNPSAPNNGAGTNPCNSSHAAIQLKDPLTGATLAGNKYSSPPVYNQQALNLQKLLPVPNSVGDPNNCGFVFYSIPYELTDNQFVTRVDYTVSPKQNIYGRYFIDGYQFPAYYFNNNILVTTQSGNIERVQTFVLGDAYTITSNLVNSAHVSILRRVDNRGYAPNDINAASLGVNLFQFTPNGLQLSVTGSRFNIGGGTNSVAHFNDNTGSIDDDVTWVHGKHQIMFGGEWVQNQLNIGNVYEGNGIFTFSGIYSASGPAGGTAVGDPNLDFLWGALGANGSTAPFQQSKKQQNALRGPIPSLYIQDTFHATSRLTLVGGLRYGPNIMPHDYFNRGVVFNMADLLANVHSTVYPSAPAGALYYGDKGVTRQFTKNSYAQFSPNVGISFDPVGNGKTVIRAGGALMFDNPNSPRSATSRTRPSPRPSTRRRHREGRRSASATPGRTGLSPAARSRNPPCPRPRRRCSFLSRNTSSPCRSSNPPTPFSGP
jgi:Carboxypeptidase regulatory-like domain